MPIVFVNVFDPVELGLVPSLARPGENITGLAFSSDLAGKRLELLREVVPKLRRVAMLWHSDNPGNLVQLKGAEAAARTVGMQFERVPVRGTHALYFKRWQHLGGDPFGARHSRALLRQVGFVNIGPSASTEVWGTPEATRARGEVFASVIESPTFCEQVITQGWADRAALEQISRALRAWGAHPDALYARIYCEAIGWKPS